MAFDSFKAYRVFNDSGKVQGRLTELSLADLGPGDVVIRAGYSSVNYKDALGATGKGKIYKTFPIVGGIDVSGVVADSQNPKFRPGDKVLVTGCGLGESHDGGYAEYVRVPSEWVVPLPHDLSLKDAMVYGTAGFTAALCIQRLEDNGQTPDKGSIIVTGASGGVGTLAVAMLAQLGYDVVAVSGKTELKPFLESLGAKRVVTPDSLAFGDKPLETARWAGAIDNVGGDMLAGILRHINLWGNVASVGLAGGVQFTATVMPHILRGVSLLGISSANCPMSLRLKLWSRLARDLKLQNLDAILTDTVALETMANVFDKMLARQTHGRIVVECQPERP